MTIWYVPVTLEQSEKHPELSDNELSLLVGSLPGGGTGSSGEAWKMIGPRRFSHTVDVEVETKEDAEQAAPDIALAAIDHDRFPGWQVTHVGEAKQPDQA